MSKKGKLELHTKSGDILGDVVFFKVNAGVITYMTFDGREFVLDLEELDYVLGEMLPE